MSAVVRTAAKALGMAICYSGALCWWRGRTNHPVILMYHSIGGTGLSPDIVVSSRRFRDHIRYLRRHYDILPLENAIEHVQHKHRRRRGVAVITFDDGYRDNYEHALPILRRYNCPAIVFVAVDGLRSGRLIWPQRLWRCLETSRRHEVRFAWSSPGGVAIQTLLRLAAPDDRAEARASLREFAGRLLAQDREQFLAALARELECDGELDRSANRAMLSWSELREMIAGGIAVGSHTLSHPKLVYLDPAAVRHELVESRRVLETELHADIPFFAYPFGGPHDFSEETKRAVLEAGYRAACSAHIASPPAVDLTALNRADIRDEPAWMLALRLAWLASHSRLLQWVLAACEPS